MGCAPLLFAARKLQKRADAVLGFRDKTRLMLADDFFAFCDNVALTTDDGSFGIHGPVTIPLREMLERGGYSGVLACGPKPMLRAVAELSESFKIPCQVSMEERMACGMGACLVCVCETKTADGEAKMSRVCRDGPVFDSAEVNW